MSHYLMLQNGTKPTTDSLSFTVSWDLLPGRIENHMLAHLHCDFFILSQPYLQYSY